MRSSHIPQRIVCLQPSATATLAALGQLDRVIACTRYCVDICPEVGDGGRIVVADSWTAKSEEILRARPDLVIASVPYQEEAVSQILRSGVRFLGFTPRTFADIYTDIACIAGITGASDRGTEVIQQMQSEIETVRRQAGSGSCPRVFCEEWGKPLIASQPWVAELVEAAGGEFLGAPGKQTTSEAVLGANPEIIIAAWCGAGDRVPLRKIIRDRAWQSVPAAQQDRVYCIRDEFLNTPAPTLIEGLRALVAAIHPDKFPQPAGLRCITAE
jgi:iron complex transport system substrate-binding protein